MVTNLIQIGIVTFKQFRTEAFKVWESASVGI